VNDVTLAGIRGAAAGLLCALAAAASEAQPQHACAGRDAGPTRTVVRVIDGETVTLDGGAELRLIGVLAPRAIEVGAEPGTWPLETAARDALRALLLGRSVELAFASERTDRYGRLQAHVFVADKDGLKWVQGHLVELGLARTYALAVSHACAGELLATEGAAREAGRGLWAEAAYSIRPADRPNELLRLGGTFQVVEGRIVRVALVRGTIYLNFGRSWRRGFSASLRRGDSALLGEHAGNPKALEGRVVRVRGWIERRGGPSIDLSAGGLFEVLEASGAASGRLR
jgi:endonuclease YncB( thermonuclease family)